jgi:serine/threonine protein phosphatase PrpC
MGNTNQSQNLFYGHHGAQGVRPSMEDAVVMIEDFGSPNFAHQSFFAVFDGHNGHRCSEFLGISSLVSIVLI